MAHRQATQLIFRERIYIVKPFAYVSSFSYIYAYIADMLRIVTASHCYFKIMSCYYLKCVSSDQEYPQL